MKEYVYTIPGKPISWASHQGYGKKSYSPHYKEKIAAKWFIKQQHDDRPLINRAVRADFFFEVPIPKSLPKKIQARIQSGEKVYCDKRPDRTNYLKFAEDVLTGIVWEDDNLVVCGEVQKYYAKNDPQTLIVIQEINESTP